ncbi:MAG: helix-turn-helix transcriptional regulator [Pirellulales bacterium]|nr:helix-turn-helix transcriptional regulator [Pirellulales bacterium]
MSMVPELRLHAPHEAGSTSNGHPKQAQLHRVREVRQAQGVSRRAAARRLGVEPRRLDEMEQPTSDLPLSAIYACQEMLQVPLEDLLMESEAPLSRPVMERAQMLKLMKTAVTIRNRAQSKPVRHLAEMLVDQLLAIMPDMVDVSPWSSHTETLLECDNGFDRERAEREFLNNKLDV